MRFAVALMVLGLGCSSTTTVPEDDRQDPPEAAGDPIADAQDGEPVPAPEGVDAEAMQAWMEAGAVGEHHTHLAGLAGKWKATTRSWPMPDAEPTLSTGTAENTVILDGRFVRLDYEGVMKMGEHEMSFSGTGLIGYDNLENWHTSIWADSFSTTILVLHGTCDDDGRRITLMGSYTDPIDGERKTMRFVYRMESADRYVLEIFMPDPDGKEYRGVEVVHERE